jgi:CBS domain-containing protein
MDHDYATVEGRLSLQDFVDEYLLRSGRRCFVVLHNGQVAGLVTPHEVKSVDRQSWSQTTVQSVMRPLRQLRTVAPDTPALQALDLMSREDVNQLPVISGGRLAGIFSRGHVLRFLRTHAEFQGS